jgi:hypothetical protein
MTNKHPITNKLLIHFLKKSPLSSMNFTVSESIKLELYREGLIGENAKSWNDWDDFYNCPIRNGHDRTPAQVGLGWLCALDTLKWKSIWFYGEPGMGKTHLAGALAVLYAGAYDARVIYCNWAEKIQRIQQSFSDSSLNEHLDREHKADLLIVDDIGAERTTHWELTLLYSLVQARMHQPTIFTSNHNLAGPYTGRPRPDPDYPQKTIRIKYPSFYGTLYRGRKGDRLEDVQVLASRISDRLKVGGDGMLSCTVFFDSEKGSHR